MFQRKVGLLQFPGAKECEISEVLSIPKDSIVAFSSSKSVEYILSETGKVWSRDGLSQGIFSLLSGCSSITQISCNSWGALFLSNIGQLYGIGLDPEDTGVLSISSSETLAPILGLEDEEIVKMSMGSMHAGALNSKGQLLTWGSCQNGQLGRDSLKVHKSTPQVVQSLSHYNLLNVACKNTYTCISTFGGSVYLIGIFQEGSEGSNIPYAISELEHLIVTHIACGNDAISVLSHTGEVYAIDRYLELRLFPTCSSVKIDDIYNHGQNFYGVSGKTILYRWEFSNDWTGYEFHSDFNKVCMPPALIASDENPWIAHKSTHLSYHLDGEQLIDSISDKIEAKYKLKIGVTSSMLHLEYPENLGSECYGKILKHRRDYECTEAILRAFWPIIQENMKIGLHKIRERGVLKKAFLRSQLPNAISKIFTKIQKKNWTFIKSYGKKRPRTSYSIGRKSTSKSKLSANPFERNYSYLRNNSSSPRNIKKQGSIIAGIKKLSEIFNKNTIGTMKIFYNKIKTYLPDKLKKSPSGNYICTLSPFYTPIKSHHRFFSNSLNQETKSKEQNAVGPTPAIKFLKPVTALMIQKPFSSKAYLSTLPPTPVPSKSKTSSQRSLSQASTNVLGYKTNNSSAKKGNYNNTSSIIKTRQCK